MLYGELPEVRADHEDYRVDPPQLCKETACLPVQPSH